MKFWTKFSRAAQAFDPAGVCDEWGAPSFAFCAKGGYHERMQRRSLGRSISKRDLGPALIHPHRAHLFHKVETITAPAPLFRRFHESSFHRIAMHVPQLLYALLRGPHVEVVEAGLPECSALRLPGKQTGLARVSPFAFRQQGSRRALLQYLHHGGRVCHLGLCQ